MAFTASVTRIGVDGDRRYVQGTFANTGGSTGGDITTGLDQVEFVALQHTGSSVVASAPVVNETLPLNGGDVTIVTVADTSGVFYARGL